MKVKQWLEKVAYLAKPDDREGSLETCGVKFVTGSYYSKFDDSYITLQGMEDDVKHLAELEITEEITHGVGFSPLHQKWYGWSHRAIYGFEIGSTCKKGDCHYIAETDELQIENAIAFWSDENKDYVHCDGVIHYDHNGNKYVNIEWQYDNSILNEKLRGQITGVAHHIGDVGRGEWVAETMDDAKQMAIDFNKGVS